MTPHEITFLIHCHAIAESFPNIDAPIMNETIPRFIDLGLIVPTNKKNVYNTTQRGAAHITQLCNTLLPRQAWVDSNDNIIFEE